MLAMVAFTPLVTQLLAGGAGLAAIGGLIFTALKFRREDTGLFISQATALVTGMDAIAEELRRERDEARKERDEERKENLALRQEVGGLRTECTALRQEVVRLRRAIEDRGKDGGL